MVRFRGVGSIQERSQPSGRDERAQGQGGLHRLARGAEECEERPAVVDPRKKKRLRSVRVAAGSRGGLSWKGV